MALVDEVKRRAARARFEAERQVRLNRAQARVGSLQGQLNTSVTRLGYLVYDLAGRDEIKHPQIAPFRDQLDGLRAQISQAEAEIRAIQAEGFVEEPRDTACSACGVTNPLAARFCRGCGRPLGQTRPAPIGPAEAPQEVACPNCGTISLPGMRFCLQCGTPLSPAAGAFPTSTSPSPISQPSPLVPAPGHASQEAPTVLIAEAGLAPPVTTAGHGPPVSADASPIVADEGRTSDASTPPSVTEEARTPEVSEPPESKPATPATSQVNERVPASPPPVEMPDATAICSACGEPIPTGAAFCVGCGEPVGG